jgi:hypothetical protein
VLDNGDTIGTRLFNCNWSVLHEESHKKSSKSSPKAQKAKKIATTATHKAAKPSAIPVSTTGTNTCVHSIKKYSCEKCFPNQYSCLLDLVEIEAMKSPGIEDFESVLCDIFSTKKSKDAKKNNLDPCGISCEDVEDIESLVATIHSEIVGSFDILFGTTKKRKIGQ